MTSTHHRQVPSGRAGPLDGLPSGVRRAATWLDPSPADYCYHGPRRCSGALVLVHTLGDSAEGTHSYDTVVACATHAAYRHGVHPDGQPTGRYRAAVAR